MTMAPATRALVALVEAGMTPTALATRALVDSVAAILAATPMALATKALVATEAHQGVLIAMAALATRALALNPEPPPIRTLEEAIMALVPQVVPATVTRAPTMVLAMTLEAEVRTICRYEILAYIC